MSAIFRVANQSLTARVGMQGQSFAVGAYISTAGAVAMNALIASGYSTMPALLLTGLGGISTLKRYQRPDITYGYMWDEDTDTAGPMLTGGGAVPGAVPTPDVIFAAMTEAERDTVVDAAFWQGQGDESAGIVAADSALWVDAHIKSIEYYRLALAARAGDATPRAGTAIRIHLDQIGRRLGSTVDASTQVIREAKLQVVAGMTNVQICAETYDLELLDEVDPLQAGNEHMSETGMANLGKRFAESVKAGGGSRLLGPSVSSVTLGTSTRVDAAITVEAGETLEKPTSPCCLRYEVNGVKVVPTSYSWSSNTLRANFATAITPGTGKFYPIYGSASDFVRGNHIRYRDPTSGAHAYYGYDGLPLRTGAPITF